MPAADVPRAAASSGSSNGSQCIHTHPSFGSQLCGAPRGASESAPTAPAGAVATASMSDVSTKAASRALRARLMPYQRLEPGQGFGIRQMYDGRRGCAVPSVVPIVNAHPQRPAQQGCPTQAATPRRVRAAGAPRAPCSVAARSAAMPRAAGCSRDRPGRRARTPSGVARPSDLEEPYEASSHGCRRSRRHHACARPRGRASAPLGVS